MPLAWAWELFPPWQHARPPWGGDKFPWPCSYSFQPGVDRSLLPCFRSCQNARLPWEDRFPPWASASESFRLLVDRSPSAVL